MQAARDDLYLGVVLAVAADLVVRHGLGLAEAAELRGGGFEPLGLWSRRGCVVVVTLCRRSFLTLVFV